MQHHLGTNLLKGGVYDPTKTVETFSRGKDRHLAPMEVRAVPARDWARFWQATSHHSQDIVAMWRHSSRRSSPLAVVTHPSGARRLLTRNRLLFVDACDRPAPETIPLYGEPGGRPTWWSFRLSCPRGRSPRMGVG